MMDRDGPLPPPGELGPLGNLITNIVGPPVLFCFAVLMGYIDCLFLVSVFCATGSSPVAAICIGGIVASYVYMWVDDVGLMPVICFAASFVTLMTALAAIFGGHSGMATMSFCGALVLLFGAVQTMKKNKIRRTGKGWIYDLLAGYLFLCGRTFFLGGLCGLIANSLFGIDVDPFRWEIVTTQNFPFVGLDCPTPQEEMDASMSGPPLS